MPIPCKRLRDEMLAFCNQHVWSCADLVMLGARALHLHFC